MFKTFRNALKIEEIRKKLFYTFLMLIVVRFGSQLPTPGVNPEYVKQFFASQTGDAFNFFNALTGGSFESMSIFALSISPYITSSIIMQLLTIAIPKLEEMQKDGEDGRKKIAEITRYLTVGLALFESSAMTFGFWRSGYLLEKNWVNVLMVITALTAGSAVYTCLNEGCGHSYTVRINALGTVYINQEFSKVMGKGSVIVDVASNSAYSLPEIILPKRNIINKPPLKQ